MEENTEDNRKKVIFVIIILFILLGLVLFFVNPSKKLQEVDGDEETNVGTTTSEKDDDEEEKSEEYEIVEEDSTTTTYEVENTSTSSSSSTDTTTTSTTTEEDTTEDSSAATEAVIKAESSLTSSTYQTAETLVNALSDETIKTELSVRLETVASAINLQSLINQLEDKVNTATNSTDITDARNYNSSNEIASTLESLTESEYINSGLVTAMASQLEEIYRILDDETAPVVTINGLNEEGYINTTPTITIEGDNDVTIYLNGEEVTEDALEDLEDGEYTLTVVDATYNETTITFIVDTMIPVVEIRDCKYTVGNLNDSNVYSKLGLMESDNYGLAGLYINDVKVKTLSGILSYNNKIEEYFAKYLNEGEENTIYVTDLAGNQSEVITFIYDSTAPTIAYTSYRVSDSDTASTSIGYWTDTLRISMASDEELAYAPTVTFTDSEGNVYVYDESLEFDLINNKGQYIYTATYSLPEEISDGEVTITISDVIDLAGNEIEAFNYVYYNKTIIVGDED